MEYRSVFLVLVIGTCTQNTGDSLFLYCLILTVSVFTVIFFLLPFQLLETAGKMTKLQKPLRYSCCCSVNSCCFCFTDILKLLFFSISSYRPKLTCRSSAHRWLPCLHRPQVKSALSSLSFILHHLCWKGWCRHYQNPHVSLFITTTACALFSSVHAIMPADISAVDVVGIPLSHR